ncbi:MAG: gliding motility-associated C-terminal domain-containing protein [Duncaniella sp.]|nr:gliding motility-associated C-terminal domain-containing protein [Duncaniella sp.]
MNRMTIAIASLTLAVSAATAKGLPEVETTGGSEQVILVEAPAGSGLDAIFVAPRVDGSVHFSVPSGGKAVQWYRFSALGAGYAEEVTAGISDNGQLSTLTPAEGDMGYYSDVAGDRSYFWLIDYSKHPYDIASLSEAPAGEQECGRIALLAPGTAGELTAYTINGRRLTVSREIDLTYNTLVWDEESQIYANTAKTETLTHISSAIHTEAPLCATVFTLSGDRFLKEWGRGQTIESPTVSPRSVDCRTSAEQAERDADNEVKPPAQGQFGGSAPCEMTFTAAVTDAAIFHEWQVSRQSDFEDIVLHDPDLEFNYTFTEQGTTYVRFYCANADASCDAYGDTYEISLGESSLKCPNAFSPFNEDGNNDIWKVSYSSIISFECSIFNRRGKLMKSFSDPSDGWDGKHGGKFVPSGVYYYVIKAVGADGRKYNLSGDINIVDYK